MQNKELLMPTSLYEEAQRRLNELVEIEKKKQAEIQSAPNGKIHIVNSKKRVQYYLRTDSSDKSGIYIQKTQMSTLQKYIQKSYDEKIQKTIQKEIRYIKKFLDNSSKLVEKTRNIYSSQPDEVKSYITPIDYSDEDYIKKWLDVDYEKKEIQTSSAVFITDRGEQVRSKSELTIANMLYKYGIPYKYECPIKIKNNIIIHPDFTVLNVKKRKVLYWEHRGMMDDRDYARHTVQRLKDFASAGIIIGDNLIITEETVASPLGTNEIENVIKRLLI